jgi:PDZ domain-containing protein
MFRGNIDLLKSTSDATKNAFNEAGKTYKVIEKRLYVYYVDKDSKSNLEVGDQILEVDNKEVNSVEGFHDMLDSYSINDTLKIKIKREDKEKIIESNLYEKDNKKLLGIFVSELNKYKTYPKVNIKFKSSESGPSGGLVEALDIYNKITKKDITNGKKIAATGEIDSDGNITEIGGVKYKLLGAAKSRADIFIAPNGKNYKECLKVKKKNHLKIKVIGVSTFKVAINELENIK